MEDKRNLYKLGIGKDILEEELLELKTDDSLKKEIIGSFNTFDVSFSFIGYKTGSLKDMI